MVGEHGFTGSYQAVKRFVRQLRQTQPVPFVRMEVEPGAEAQVDFGQGAWVLVEGKRKRPHLFRIVLSHSRKGYSEVVWQQTTESFIRCLENAFRYFGGVPRTLIIDNLRAAVTRADWYDPETQRQGGRVLPPLRHGDAADTPGHAAAQRQDRGGREVMPRTTRSRAAALKVWRRKTCFSRSGKAAWPTPAFTAPRANRLARCSNEVERTQLLPLAGGFVPGV